MAELVQIKFKKGWVDGNGGVWLPGMTASVSAETAKQLIADGTAEHTKPESKLATPPKE